MITIFDSGIGGMSILRELRPLVPAADILYYGDTRYMPYGSKRPEFIYERIAWFIETYDDQVDMYVIACNSATVSLIDDYRKLSDKPFIGIEPGVKPAVAATQSGHIAVLATEKTCDSPQLEHLIAEFGSNATMSRIPCVGLAEAIERTPNAVESLVKKYTAQLPMTVDTIVLACTHYPLIKTLFEKHLPRKTIIDVSAAVAQHAANVYGRLSVADEPGNLILSCSGKQQQFLTAVQRVTPSLFDQATKNL